MMHQSLSAALGAASLAALLAVSVPASAASIVIQGNAFCNFDPAIPPGSGVCVSSSSGSESDALGLNPIGNVTVNTLRGSATANATALLNFGALGASAHVQAHGESGFLQSHLAQAIFNVVATDTITITSSTLAVGTAVSLHFTLVLDSLVSTAGTTANNQAGGTATTKIFSGDGEFNPLGLNLSITDDSDFGPPADRTLVQDVIAHIGDVVDIVHELRIGAEALVNTTDGGDAVADVLALNTAHLFIDVIGSDATITTASGTNYSSGGGTGPTPGVPAPAGVGLFLLGLAGVAALRRRRAG